MACLILILTHLTLTLINDSYYQCHNFLKVCDNGCCIIGQFSTSSEVRLIIPAFQRSACCCLQLVDYHYCTKYTVKCLTQNWYNETFYFISVMKYYHHTRTCVCVGGGLQILLIWLLNSCISCFVYAWYFSCYRDDTFVINIFLIVARTYYYCHNRLYQQFEKVV